MLKATELSASVMKVWYKDSENKDSGNGGHDMSEAVVLNEAEKAAVSKVIAELMTEKERICFQRR